MRRTRERRPRPWAGDPWVVVVDLAPPLLSEVLTTRLARPDLLVLLDPPEGSDHDVRITASGDATGGGDGQPVVELHLPAGSRVRTPAGSGYRVIELECGEVGLLVRALELLCPVDVAGGGRAGGGPAGGPAT